MDATELKRLKDLEEENLRLKPMYAELALDLLKVAKEMDPMLAQVWWSQKALNPFQKRQIVEEMSPPAARGISRVCRVLNLSKSVYYYQSRKDDEPVEAALRQKAGAAPGRLLEGLWALAQ